MLQGARSMAGKPDAAPQIGSLHLGRANVFLPVSNTDSFLDVFDTIREWQAQQPVEAYFYALFARDPSASFEERRRQLSSTMIDAGRVLLVMDMGASAASDLWCVFEVALAQELCVSLEVAMAPRFALEFLSALERDPMSLMSMFCIDVKDAATPDAADALCIKSVLSDGVGNLRVNQAIVSVMQEWAVVQGRSAIASLDHDDERGFISLANGLALLLQAFGRYAEAESLLRDALVIARRRLGDSHDNTLALIDNIANLLHMEGKLAEAEPLHREALDARRRLHGNEHPRFIVALFNYARLRWAQGRLDEAMPLFEEELATTPRVMGETHSDTLVSMANMGRLLQEQKKLGEAEELIRRTLLIRQRTLGDEHIDSLASLADLAWLLQEQKRFSEADAILRRVYDVRRRVLGEEHPSTLESFQSIALLRRDQGDLASALELMGNVIERGRETISSHHPAVLGCMNDAAYILLVLGRYDEALVLLAEAAPGMQEVLGRDHPDTRGVTANWAITLAALARPDESAVAEALLPPLPAELPQHPHALSSVSASGVAASARLPSGWCHKCSLCHANALAFVYCCSETGCDFVACVRCHEHSLRLPEQV